MVSGSLPFGWGGEPWAARRVSSPAGDRHPVGGGPAGAEGPAPSPQQPLRGLALPSPAREPPLLALRGTPRLGQRSHLPWASGQSVDWHQASAALFAP